MPCKAERGVFLKPMAHVTASCALSPLQVNQAVVLLSGHFIVYNLI